MKRILATLRGQPWAIVPEWLEALDAIVMNSAGAEIALPDDIDDGHEARYDAAIANMGSRLPGSKSAAVNGGVASIPLFGPVIPRSSLISEMSGATSLQSLAHDMRVAQNSDDVDAILLVIDSPGGAVSGTAEFAGMVASSNKPVHAHVTGLGASAAYWIASQTASITIDRTALVGSIGVALSTSVQEETDRDGYRHIDIVSSSAANKRPDMASEEGRQSVVAELDEIEKVFISDVAKGRNVTPNVVRSDFGAGGMKVGAAAVKAGMADRVDTLEMTLKRLGGRKAKTGSFKKNRAKAEISRRQRAINGVI